MAQTWVKKPKVKEQCVAPCTLKSQWSDADRNSHFFPPSLMAANHLAFMGKWTIFWQLPSWQNYWSWSYKNYPAWQIWLLLNLGTFGARGHLGELAHREASEQDGSNMPQHIYLFCKPNFLSKEAWICFLFDPPCAYVSKLHQQCFNCRMSCTVPAFK